MTDYFQDRIKLNPKLDIKESAGPLPGRQSGSIDSHRTSDFAESKDVTVAKERPAPKNEAPDWSA